MKLFDERRKPKAVMRVLSLGAPREPRCERCGSKIPRCEYVVFQYSELGLCGWCEYQWQKMLAA